MYFHSVELNNYKSIGNSDLSKLIIEPGVTAIIGKNESGKSNVLEGLSHISFTQNMDTAFRRDNINRSDETHKGIKYNIILKAQEDEKNIIKSDTEITITQASFILRGGAIEYFNLKVRDKLESLIELLGQNPFRYRDQDLQNYKGYIKELSKDNELNLHKMNYAFQYIKARLSQFNSPNKETVLNAFDVASNAWENFIALFPKVFYRLSDKILKTRYSYEEVQKELQVNSSVSNSLLFDLVRLIKIPPNDFLEAVRIGLDGSQESIRYRINKRIDKYINTPFKNFYNTESVSLAVRFNAGTINFTVVTAMGEALLLSERSNGLKWYLNTFIDMQANNITGSNTLFLLDEPGISLHVNAQRELIKLFKHLSDNGNQVIYTTHSPYMLDTNINGIHDIRAIIKDADGNTSIYKTCYDSRIAPENQRDTLTPIINAIGMNLQYTFGPALNKINIVTEGISDYIYLHSIAKKLELDMKKIAFIPCVGASNCVNICAILRGWGCQYIALFDYDTAGVKSGGEIMANKYNARYRKDYCYLIDVSEQEIADKTYETESEKMVIEDLISAQEIERFRKEQIINNQLGKPLLAKVMGEAIVTGDFQLQEDIIIKFKNLFERIFSYFI